MRNFWESHKFRIIGAVFGILFHTGLLHVVTTWTGTVGLLLIIFYFPIYIILLILDSWFGYFGNEWFEVCVGVGGTIMYALLGWKVGPFVERCVHYSPARAPTPPKPEQPHPDNSSETDKENQS